MIVSPTQAVEILSHDRVVAIPTETVYGLAARISSPSAIESIFATKQRPYFDPLIVHVSSVDQARNLSTSWSKSVDCLAQKFWPGPLTIVTDKTAKISSLITADKETVALRMPNHPLALEIINQVGPLAAPSANKFGRTSPSQAQHVEDAFNGTIPVVDGGTCLVGIESTIVQLEELDSETITIKLLRPGHIKSNELITELKKHFKHVQLKKETTSVSPGSLNTHYQPNTPLVLASSDIPWNEELHQQVCSKLGLNNNSRMSYWNFAQQKPYLVARTLYLEMRLQSQASDYIFLNLPKEILTEDWEAVHDRLARASSLEISKLHDELAFALKTQASVNLV